MTLKAYYLGRNDTDGTALFAIGTRRYEYALTPQQLDTVEHLCHKVSVLKALNFAKRRHRPNAGAHVGATLAST